MNSFDPYFKKVITYRYAKQNLQFRVSQELFSSQVIDHGTQRLLRTIDSENLVFKKALDVGCGYGPVGISLKKANPDSEFHLTDKDALALDYTRQNAELNEVSGLKIYASLGLDEVQDRDFDLIISNIPAKVGDKVLEHMLLDTHNYLLDGGKAAVVVIDAITEVTKKILSGNNNVRVLFKKSWTGHTVFHYEFESNWKKEKLESGFKRGLYDRTINNFKVHGKTFSIKTTYNLPEFDTLSYDTELLLRNLGKIKKYGIHNVIVFNPGQGYIPVALNSIFALRNTSLVDRDLQALKVSKRSLVQNGLDVNNIDIFHQVGFTIKTDKQSDLVIGIVPKKQDVKVYEMYIDELVGNIKSGGLLMLTSTSSTVSRLEKKLHKKSSIQILESSKYKGNKNIIMHVK